MIKQLHTINSIKYVHNTCTETIEYHDSNLINTKVNDLLLVHVQVFLYISHKNKFDKLSHNSKKILIGPTQKISRKLWIKRFPSYPKLEYKKIHV